MCLFRNPALDKHKSGKYMAHSEHVTRVKFTDDSKYIFSVGGQDQTVIMWSVGKGKKKSDDDE